MASKKISSEDKNMAMLAHLLAIFTGFLGPLVLFIALKDKDDFVYDNARHSLNFQLSVMIYSFISIVLILILIGFLMLFVIGIFALVVEIIASVRAYSGEVYKYPLEIEFIRARK